MLHLLEDHENEGTLESRFEERREGVRAKYEIRAAHKFRLIVIYASVHFMDSKAPLESKMRINTFNVAVSL